MSKTLTSWKEIAQHFGKGVRTVQRWEHSLGLPARRPQGHNKGIVLALDEELDVWMQSQFENGRKSDLELLRSQVAELARENETLRAKLASAESGPVALSRNGWSMGEHNYESTAAEFHRVRTIAAQRRLQAIRSTVALGFTICRVAETSLLFGHNSHAHQAIANVQKLCNTVQHHLQEENHISANEVENLRAQVSQLASIVSAAGNAQVN